jgi:hypothetical protein
MEKAGTRLNIRLFDACRNSPFRSFRSTAQGLAEMKAPSGIHIQYATEAGSVAIDQDEKRNNELVVVYLKIAESNINGSVGRAKNVQVGAWRCL